jgi:hypothetical protein
MVEIISILDICHFASRSLQVSLIPEMEVIVVYCNKEEENYRDADDRESGDIKVGPGNWHEFGWLIIDFSGVFNWRSGSNR